jgi:hypothetical protein
MEKPLKFVRIFLFCFGLIFFLVGAGIGYSFYNSPNQDSPMVLPLVFMGIGFIDMMIVIIWTVVSKKKAAREQWLLQNGQQVKAKFISVNINTMISVNNRNPYFINCQWQDTVTGMVHVFKSKNLWFDPAPYIDAAKNINVYIDPANPKSYAIDLSFLPPSA